jgi:hypothetical protein
MASRVSLIQSRSIYVGTSNSVAPSDGNLIVSGNVGIGTTSPGVKLEVIGGTSNINGYTDGIIQVVGLSPIAFVAPSNLNPSLNRWGFTLREVDEGDFSIRNIRQNTTPLIIKDTGNVGIGTTSPSTKLQVIGAGRVLNVSSSNDQVPASFGCSTGGVSTIGFYAVGTSYDYVVRVGANVNDFVAYTNDTERLRITVGGNVGIGTTSPQTRLQVVSNIDHVSGDISINKSILDLYNNYESDVAEKGAILTFSDNYYDSVGPQKTIRAAIKGGTQLAGNTADGFLAFYTDSSSANSATERVRINASGNVGIGTTSPAVSLQVNASTAAIRLEETSASAKRLEFSIDSSAVAKISANQSAQSIAFETVGSERMRITDAGNVGIGTTSPTDILHVYKSGASTRMIVGNNANYDQYIYFQGNNDWSIGIDASNSSAFTLSNYSTIGTNDRITVTTAGNVGIGITAPLAPLDVNGNVYIRATGALFTNTIGGFTTNVVSIGASTNFIVPSGSVGIGTTSPSEKLTVLGSDATTFQGAGIYNSYTYGNADKAESRFNLGKLEGSTYQPMGAIGAFPTDNTNSGNGILSFYTRTSQSVTEKMRITSGGNVGIGTTSPSEKLHVSGRVRIGDYMKIASDSNYMGQIGFNRNVEDGTIYNTSYGAHQVQNYNGTLEFQVFNSSGIYVTQHNMFANGNVSLGGNVGIGTTSPNSKLDVRRTSSGIAAEFISTAGTLDEYIDLKLISGNDAAGTYGTILRHQRIGSSGADFAILTNPTLTGTPVERFRITKDGNVGIGTTSPGEKLEVAGNGQQWIKINNADNAGANGIAGIKLFANNTYRAAFYFNDNAGVTYLDTGVGTGQALVIGGTPLSFFTSSTERMRVSSTGNVGIGTTAPQQLLHVLGATNGYMMVQGADDAGQAGIYFKKEDTTGTMDRTKGLIVFHTNVGSGFGRGHLGFCLNSADSNAIVSVSDEKFRMVDNGDFLADGDVVAYSTTISDERYKTNITPIDSALDKVNQMRGVSFDWTAVRSGREFGVIAQDIEKIAPEVVSEKELLNGETMKTVSYTSLVPFLIESIKELTQQVNELKAQLDGLTK